MKSERLKGDVAVVTGAASGLDRGIALELSQHGAMVACADINAAENQKTVDMIKEAGGEAFPVEMNVAKSDSVKKAMKEVFDRTGRITILINGAAIAKFSPIEVCSDEEWHQVMAVNIDGCFYCLREVYPYMKQTGGRIVQLSSTSAKSGGNFGGAHYSASKGGVISLSKYAARRWVKEGIRVNTICPGVSDTNLTQDPDMVAGSMEKMSSEIPMGRLGTPEDMAGAVMFLVSDESRYITGITIDVTGGRYMYGN